VIPADLYQAPTPHAGSPGARLSSGALAPAAPAGESVPDPTDVASLRALLVPLDPENRLRPIGMRRVIVGREALGELETAVEELIAQPAAPGDRVVMLTDATVMRRGQVDLKREVAARLGARFTLEHVVLGEQGNELHADEAAVARAGAAAAGARCVVAVGSGTITDIAKEATAAAGGVPLLVVQTAASVNAFSDNMAVITRAGAKRTVPSRWPDVLLIDVAVLADAPAAMNLAGFGDLLAVFTAPADWYLASLLGMDPDYHAAPAALTRERVRALLPGGARLAQSDPDALDELARALTLSGFTMGVAGTTAPLSGSEHLVSHLLDMAAEQAGRPLAFHGAQVAVATVPVAAAWEILLAELDPACVRLDSMFPPPVALEPRVRAAFAGLDPSGAMGDECWRDVRAKLAAWTAARPAVEAFLADWSRHRASLASLVLPARDLGAALCAAGAPARFAELDPSVPPDLARWALLNCPLMRDRFTLVDLLFFLGWWDEAFVDRILERAADAGGGL